MGGDGNDSLSGGIGNDRLLGESGDDTLLGEDEADYLDGGGGNDLLEGGDGDDNLVGGAGADILNGGDGFDTADYRSSPSAISLNLETGIHTGGDVEGDTLVAIERIYGSSFADMLIGDAGDNQFYGDMSDVAIGGAGADYFVGIGNISYITSSGAVHVDLVNGIIQGNDADGDSFLNVSNFEGSQFNDTLIARDAELYGADGDDFLGGDSLAGSGDERLDGGDGNDTLRGYGGADRLYGGQGDDSLLGNLDADFLDGQDGNDTLNGGGGDDILKGGGGADMLRGGADDDWFFYELGGGNDTVVDNVSGMGSDDVIWIIDFGTNFDEFSEIIGASSQVGDDVVIDFGGGDTLTILDTQIGDLHADDFTFYNI